MLIKGRIDTSLMYIHTSEYYTVMKIHRLEVPVSTWKNLKNMIFKRKKQVVNVIY